jgi:hypothetical protein
MNHSPYSLLNPQEPTLKGASDKYSDTLKRISESNCDVGLGPASDVLNEVCGMQPKNLILGRMTRSQTQHSLSASSTSSSVDSGILQESSSRLHENFSTFGMDLRRETNNRPDIPIFDKGMRRVMEPHLRKARMLREKVRNCVHPEVHASIASSVGVPYVRLRRERPFLFDIHTHPIHEVLTDTLGVEDLSKIHEEGDLQHVMEPLLSREGRYRFQEAYDTFVTSFCIPLLHSLAMSHNLFHSVSADSSISYRYQAFPKIRVLRPGDMSEGPSCGTASGHSIGYLHFHVPMTATFGTNALYTESHPGREDWHPMVARSVGLGYLFDGARCLHFNMENTTEYTSVSLDFVIAVYSDETDETYVDGDGLCNMTTLEDRYSLMGPGYYDEASIDVGLGGPSWQIVAKKYGNHLLEPDARVGFPFS